MRFRDYGVIDPMQKAAFAPAGGSPSLFNLTHYSPDIGRAIAPASLNLNPAPFPIGVTSPAPIRSVLLTKTSTGSGSATGKGKGSGRGKKMLSVGLTAMDNGDGQSATITWAVGQAPAGTTWDLICSPAPSSGDLANRGGSATINSSPYVLQGLTPGVAYSLTLQGYVGNSATPSTAAASVIVTIGAASAGTKGTQASVPVSDMTVVGYDPSGNPINAESQVVPGAPNQSQATNGTTSPGGGSPGSSSGSGGTSINAAGNPVGPVVGYDANGNPVDANGNIVPGACGGLAASVAVGYDSNGNPLDCNGLPLPGANPCSGVVAGYDSNGNPVDCNGLPVPGASACGGVMAGTDQNGNPVDCNGLPVSAGASVSATPGGALATAMNVQPTPGGALTTAAGLPGAVGTPVTPVSGNGIWWLLGGVTVVGLGAWWLGKKAA